MTDKEFYQELARETAVAIADQIKKVMAPIEQRLSRLEQKVEQLEQRDGLPDRSEPDRSAA